MTAITFDTYAFVTKLKEAGIPEQQAAAQIETLTKAIDSALEQVRHEHDLDNLVTNKDMDARIRETELKIELVRSELKRDIAESKAEMIRWVVGVGILQTTLITGVLLKLTHLI
ncbi:MAG: CCDC90 family protein [Methylovulum sp.]|nr:CCDC90 family protein [Methylovulum sp.]